MGLCGLLALLPGLLPEPRLLGGRTKPSSDSKGGGASGVTGNWVMGVCDGGGTTISEDVVNLCLCSFDLMGDWARDGAEESRGRDPFDSGPLSSLDSEKMDESLFAIINE
jgi:hypothetical protein